jgi:hydroxypyruvate isomerase
MELIPKLSSLGIRNMIIFSGNRKGRSDEEGMKNCVSGLTQLLPAAEKANVTLVMELLNSKRDHKDYMCDHTAWGAALGEKLGSKHFKLLYDVYHMQIMEGDVIETIRQFQQHIGHYHTGGVPGRNEIDGTQEINYRRVCEAIVETGFQGWLAHEFIPKGDPMTSLREAYNICNV